MAKQRLIVLAGGVVLTAFVVAVTIVALGNTDGTRAPQPTAVVAAAATPSPQSTPRPVTAGPRPTATPLSTPTRPLDLATAPQLRPADKTVTLQPPQSPFKEHDGRSIVLFDTESKTQTGFGAGMLANSPFARDKFTFVDASGEAWLVDLPGLKRTSLGKAPSASFVDDYRIALGGNNAASSLYDTRTGATTALSTLSQAERNAIFNNAPPFDTRLNLPAGWTRVESVINAGEDPCRNLTGNTQRLCWTARPEDVVLQDGQGKVAFSFRALRIAPAGNGELLVATPPVCSDGGRSLPCIELLNKLGTRDLAYDDPGFATGTTNLYVLDLMQGTTRFIATARYNLQTQMLNANWPLEADANFVVWTDYYCGPTRGQTRILDRRTDAITDLGATHWFTLRNGKLGLGEFGARTVIDPATQQFLAVLPEVRGDVRWSADYRYAAVSAPVGHGGLCP